MAIDRLPYYNAGATANSAQRHHNEGDGEHAAGGSFYTLPSPLSEGKGLNRIPYYVPGSRRPILRPGPRPIRVSDIITINMLGQGGKLTPGGLFSATHVISLPPSLRKVEGGRG